MTKFFSIATFAIILQASLVLAWPDCATNDPEDLTFYPMSKCNKFYQCVNGKQAIFTCQEGLVFNFKKQYCDYPENVNCENQVCGPEENLTFYPMPKCNQFYQCVDGEHYVFTCQEGLVFNFEEQVCDDPENVEC